jgi:RND family efflux transporter MFP subunit
VLKKRLLIPAVLAAGLVVVGLASVMAPGIFGGVYAQEKKPAATSGSGETKKKKRRRRRRQTLVQVDKVRIAPLLQTVPVIGRIVAVRAGAVAARIDAPVADMKVDVGDHVKKGDVLASLVTERFKWDREQKAAEVTESQAKISTARARLSLARQELKRISDLKTSAAYSKARFEDKRVEVTRYQAELAEARARLLRTRASLNMAETELRYTKIRAPYSGVITKRHTEAGAFIKEGQAAFTMVSDRDLEIEADVPGRRIAGLTAGKKVTFELVRGQRIEARVRAVVPEENVRTRTRMVRFKPNFKIRPENIAANQSATVYLPIGKSRTGLSMHKDALVSSRGVPTVFVIRDGRAYARQVKIGEGVGGRFEVLSGLKEGEQVVIRGNERLKDGKRVRINGVSN